MKTYKIEVIKTTKEFDHVVIEANCPQEAKETARQLAKSEDIKIKWDLLQKPNYQAEIIND